MPVIEKPNQNIKIPFDSLTLCAVLTELSPQIIGGQIQEVRQPTPTDIQLSVRHHGQTYWIVFSIDVKFARMHRVATRSPNSPTPPNFCMVLRRYLENGIVQDVIQRDFDRIVEMQVSTRDNEGEPIVVKLIGEFMGKHSNLVLVRENGTIIDSAKRITHRVNRFREILPGSPYLSPPPQADRESPFDFTALAQIGEARTASTTPSQKALSEKLMQTYSGLSPFLASEVAMRALSQNPPLEESLKEVWIELFGATAQGRFTPVLIQIPNGLPYAYPFPTLQARDEEQRGVTSLNLALDHSYQVILRESRFQEEANTLRGQLQKAIQRLEYRQQATGDLIAEGENSEQFQQIGELIMANLWQIAQGDTSVVVQDYFAPDFPERTLTLDSSLTPQENAEQWFQRYRRAQSSASAAEEQSDLLEKPLQALQEAQAELEALEDEAEHAIEMVRALRKRLRDAHLLTDEAEIQAQAKRVHSEFQGHKIRRMNTPQGYEILIGETATANDFLLTRLASPNDIWLHVRASSGSHVVIRTQNHPDKVPRAVLDFAALLCAQHSSEKHASIVPVDYTLRKYVRKPRGSAPGFAHYERETTLHVTP